MSTKRYYIYHSSLIVVWYCRVTSADVKKHTRFYETQKIKSQHYSTALFHRTMTISATAATASPRSRCIPSQHQVCWDCPHRNIACNHPAAWFGQIRHISREIGPYLPRNLCYTATMMTGNDCKFIFTVSIPCLLPTSSTHRGIHCCSFLFVLGRCQVAFYGVMSGDK